MAHAAAVPVAASPKPQRVLFARIGWMTHYAGPQPGDERPTGGGGYNKKNVGHEVFNFAEFNGRLYGMARAKNGRIDTARIDPSAAGSSKLENVLVIFVAHQCVIGWYAGATVYGIKQRPFPPSVAKEMNRRLKQMATKGFKLEGYQFEAPVKTAVLLPTHERQHRVPGNVKGGFGQSNICYSYLSNGKAKAARWMNAAIEYVLSYSKPNLLTAPYAEATSEVAAAVAQEQAAGFQSDSHIRNLVEQHAMKTARVTLEKRGYCGFKNTSASNPYDYICEKDGKQFYVEVKGTQTSGKKIILTKGEVDHVHNNPTTCILVLVHSVTVAGKKTATGGTVVLKEGWQLRPEDLTAIQYVWATATV